MPATRSVVTRLGSIIAVMNRENAATITSTGGAPDWSPPSGIDAGGNHRSHCTTWPGSCWRRSAGSAGAYSGRIARTRSRSQLIDPPHPMRSAITVAGIVGCCASSALILGSTALIADSTDGRRYFGVPSLVRALVTVSRAIPSLVAMARFDSFSL